MSYTHIALWIEEAPPPIVEEALRVIVDGFHDLVPVQTLDPFSELDVALAAATHGTCCMKHGAYMENVA